MKRWITVLSAMLLMPALAMAQSELVSISELRAQVEKMGRCAQSYKVQGQTIDVDVPIIVPEVTKMPILKCIPLKILE